MPQSANIAQHLPLMAAARPGRVALKIPRGRTSRGDIDYLELDFAALEAEVAAWAAHLDACGVRPGDRTLVMVRQGLPLIASAFALFRIGAVPVVIDPGMGLRNFLNCVARSRPRVLLGIPLARLISHVARMAFRSVEIRVAASGSALARKAKAGAVPPSVPTVFRTPPDLAAILFTSGSTGAPKGVCYEHGMFASQVELIRETYRIEPGEIDLPMLPVFALFNPALGMTTIVPEIDPSRPAAVDPAKIVQAIRQEGVTNSFGSPTLWGKIADHCLAGNIELPSLKRVLCAGAPVPVALWRKSPRFLPGGMLHSPYGATESLPISSISANEMLDTLREDGDGAGVSCGDRAADGLAGRGACVGRPVRGVEVKVIAITEGAIAGMEGVAALPAREIGELVVSGPVVTREYDGLPAATAEAKIPDGGRIWHRMGDCGYIDDSGRVWFCGRKAERVVTAKGTMFTEPCEQVFRSVPGVSRCALIGLGCGADRLPALVVQPTSRLSAAGRQALASELRAQAAAHAPTSMIRRFYFHPDFPVDVRHNAKIHRLTLAKWAGKAQAYEIP